MRVAPSWACHGIAALGWSSRDPVGDWLAGDAARSRATHCAPARGDEHAEGADDSQGDAQPGDLRNDPDHRRTGEEPEVPGGRDGGEGRAGRDARGASGGLLPSASCK